MLVAFFVVHIWLSPPVTTPGVGASQVSTSHSTVQGPGPDSRESGGKGDFDLGCLLDHITVLPGG